MVEMTMKLSPVRITTFQNEIYGYYHTHGRKLPWRNTTDPYHIVVSEIMLQQTQVKRVLTKYDEFIRAFPSFVVLSRASLKEVMKVWKGMGYNRRALALLKIAHKVVHEYKGKLPDEEKVLVTFPGIGKATASSVCTFAYNLPTVFIETNIRSVFLYYFFKNKEGIDDKEIIPLIQQTLDVANPREWYYALMDYGSMLKSKIDNPSKKSAHYRTQSRFEGSRRQSRGALLRLLSHHDTISLLNAGKELGITQEKVKEIAHTLQEEGFLTLTNTQMRMKE